MPKLTNKERIMKRYERACKKFEIHPDEYRDDLYFVSLILTLFRLSLAHEDISRRLWKEDENYEIMFDFKKRLRRWAQELLNDCPSITGKAISEKCNLLVIDLERMAA